MGNKIQEHAELFANFDDSIMFVDVNGDGTFSVASINSAAERSFGLDCREVRGKCKRELFPADLAARLEGYDRACVASGETVRYEEVLDLPSGLRCFSVTHVPMKDEAGRVFRIAAIARDITERKATEDALKESEARYQQVFEHSQEGLFLFDVTEDERFRLIEANHAFERLIGVPRAVMIGKCSDEILSVELARKIDEKFRRCLAAGTIYEEEILFDIASGRRTCLSTFVPVRDGNGDVLRISGLMRDVTERRLYEQALLARAEQERRLSSFVDSAPGFFFSLQKGADGSISMPFASPGIADIVGLRPEDVAFGVQPLLARYHPDDAASVQQKVMESGLNLTPCHAEFRVLNPDKGTRWVEARSMPHLDENGNICWHGFMQDVTERKQMETLLKKRENEFRSLAETSPDLIARFDRDCHRLYANQAMAALAGKSAETLVGAPPTDGVILAPAHAEKLMSGIRSVFADKARVRIDLSAVYSSGCEHQFDALLVPEFGADGEVETVLLLSRDITERKLMENELKQSRNFLGGVLDGIFDPIFVKDRQHRWIMINDAFCTLIGKSREMLIGKSDYDFFPKEQADVFWEKDELVFESGEVNLNEESITTASGQTHFIQTKKTSYISEDGSPMLVGVIRDITDRKQAETKLMRAIEFSEGIINAIPDLLFEIDGEGRYLNVWAQNQELLAAQKEILLGSRIADVLAPDAAAVVMDALREANERGISLGHVIQIDLPGGASWFELSVSRKSTDNPCKPHFLVLSRDITERRQAEKSLRDSMEKITNLNHYLEEYAVRLEENARDLEDQAVELEAQTVELEASQAQLKQTEAWYRSILHSAPDGMLVVDERGLIVQVNAQLETMFGYREGELSGSPIEMLLPPGRRDTNAKMRADFIAGNEAYRDAMQTQTLSACRKDGTEFPVDVSLSRLPVLGEQRGMICASVRDITQRHAMEAAREGALAEALRLAQLRSAFMAQMSHELRTPLNGILGYTQNLLYGSGLDEKQLAGLRIIQHSGEHLLSLINGLLDHAAIEAGKFELVSDDIELDSFLSAIIGIIRVRAEQKNLSFSCDAQQDLPAVVRGDAQRLRQVLINLLANAVKFTDSGVVTLRVGKASPSRICFLVQDSGIGISPEQFENIFLPFEQAGEASRRAGGTGLGLAISRKLVRLMGGDIKLESRLGVGSVFSFDIEMQAASSDSTSIDAASLSALAATSLTVPSYFAPPAHELEILHQMALRGSMREVMRHADHLLESDERYLDFVAQIRQLTKRFQTKALLALLEQYRKGIER